MDKLYDLDKKFAYENGFYATADPSRFSKFITHLEFFKQTSNVRGEIVEFGIFKGNSFFRWIKFRDLLEQTNSRKVIGFDIFGDFPEANFEEDKEKRDAFVQETNGGKSISLEEINELLQKQGLHKNVDIIKGDILVTLDEYLEKNPHLKISLLHIDVDLYEPTKHILEKLYQRVTTGGIIILDDYGAFAGTNKAVDDFFQNNAEIKKLPFSHAISYIVK
ncbi:TylF/MycF/NovP-related O-methyltransferase [Flavobacterium sp. CFBP9031]|uniref:TylF/MycF/NovP-related O-methyltransferase n=1 Tax=Flavobacterium sp. CFBP9031 TaxID=3096538 RepID=UPI002A6A51A6|nr:TylF/MycF/NovP-related O-methyltransferase [Flavobacterium sp. CFBP9031]MDY0987422.1 TylF/MycF/NovP-related O-methyltransferase [Flavobacterium sp. CFBP9031]